MWQFVVLVATSAPFGLVHDASFLNGAAIGPTLGEIGLASLGSAGFYIRPRLHTTTPPASQREDRATLLVG